MIEHLDKMLRQMLTDRVAPPPSTVGFQPPNEDWRTKAIPAGGTGLNVYLVELRENRRLRTLETTSALVDGDVIDTPAPRRVDCHYLISAWSMAQNTPPASEPTLIEHRLLHGVASAFANHDPLIANEIFASTPFPPGFPADLVDQALPISVLAPEGYAKLPEFWGTMGDKQPLKPVVHLVVTLPLAIETRRAGPIVTTRALTFRFAGDPAPGETLFEIGGFVLNAAAPLPGGAPAPLAGVWVELLAAGGARLQLTQSNAQGRFAFNRLRGGDYQLRAAAEGFPVLTRTLRVPSPDGDHALTFS